MPAPSGKFCISALNAFDDKGRIGGAVWGEVNLTRAVGFPILGPVPAVLYPDDRLVIYEECAK